MTENIATGTEIVKADNPGAKVIATTLSDAEFTEQLEALARDIEHLDRRARDTMFRIAARIAKAHELFLPRRDEGGFSGWVENRLRYSRAYAYRMLNVDRWAKSVSSWDTFGTLPVSAIYLLAEPSVSDEVRDEIINRLKAGEKLSVAAVTEIIARAKDATNTGVLMPPAGTSAAVEDEDESITQRRREHDALFGEPAAEIDQHNRGSADGGGNDHNDRGADPKSGKSKTSATPTGFERTLSKIHAYCTNSDDMVVPELTAQERDEALNKLAECMGALQIIAGKIGGPKAETLIDHWRRSPDELTALLDTVTVQKVCAAMSPEFRAQLRDRLPKRASDKPYEHTLNHKAARNGRGHHSRQ